MSLSLMPDNQHILASIKNISYKKLFEEQSKLAIMGEMIGNITHQWRQPLSVISTIASGISFRSEMGTLEDYNNTTNDMEMIMVQINYLSHTIEDFLSFHNERLPLAKEVFGTVQSALFLNYSK
jgi:signal transduction histidine kinase